jgi:hypothetical protein
MCKLSKIRAHQELLPSKTEMRKMHRWTLDKPILTEIKFLLTFETTRFFCVYLVYYYIILAMFSGSPFYGLDTWNCHVQCCFQPLFFNLLLWWYLYLFENSLLDFMYIWKPSFLSVGYIMVFIFRYWYTRRNNFDYCFNFSWFFPPTSWQERAGYNFCLLCLVPNWPATDVTGNMTSDPSNHSFIC